MIAPDHGLIWRGKDDCKYILDTYRALAEQKPKQRAVIVYDSMWGSTGIMASAIASGLEDEGVPVRIIDIQKNHHSDVMTPNSPTAARSSWVPPRTTTTYCPASPTC